LELVFAFIVETERGSLWFLPQFPISSFLYLSAIASNLVG